MINCVSYAIYAAQMAALPPEINKFINGTCKYMLIRLPDMRATSVVSSRFPKGVKSYLAYIDRSVC